jgi:Pilus formation protein N terminal region
VRHLTRLCVMALVLYATGDAIAQPEQKLELKPNFTTLIQFNEPVRTLAIGNPEIADISPVKREEGPPPVYSDRSFLITARKVGETNLIAVNAADKVIYRGTLLVGGGEIGRMTVHSRKSLHEYWTYRCSEYNCQRFDDKYERQPAPPIFVVPASQPPGSPAGPSGAPTE